LIGIQEFRSQSGLKVMNKARKLLVSRQNQFVAERLTKSEFRTNTANNDINAIYSMSAIPQGYAVNQYIELSNFWGIGTDCPEALRHFIREPLDTDIYTDFATKNMLCSAIERYSFGVRDWRGMFASQGAA
jgi:hypothetical protein